METSSNTVTNRIDELFERCRAENRGALVLYLTSGFPNAEVTRRILPVLAEAGCDLVELGIPFSDPIADGPTIQRASTVALEAGMTFPQALEILAEFRATRQMPVILFGALNPFLVRGFEEASQLSAKAGADGVLAADLPVEEAGELRETLFRQNMHLINLIAPTTPSPRIRRIAEQSSGFLYCIALKGTTGARTAFAADAREYLARVRNETDMPLALGFGISQPEHVRTSIDAGADAVVVGSALINLIDDCVRNGRDLETEVANYVHSLAAELKK